jgi:lipoate-protein ligase A
MDLDLAVQALSPGCIESVEQGKQALARKVGWLNRFSAIPVEIPALREAIIIAFQRRLADAIVPSVFTVDERRRARRLRISKYGYSAWTSGRKTMPEDNSAAKPI